jgi:hypothetical protein
VAVFEEIGRRHPELTPGVRRTMECRIARWRALNGPSRDVIFRQEHPPGRMGLSDFTDMRELAVTIAGEPLDAIAREHSKSTNKMSSYVGSGRATTARSRTCSNTVIGRDVNLSPQRRSGPIGRIWRYSATWCGSRGLVALPAEPAKWIERLDYTRL